MTKWNFEDVSFF